LLSDDGVVVLEFIPFSCDPGEFLREIHLPQQIDISEDAVRFLERAQPLLRPKALYRECYIDGRDREGVVIEGVKLSSPSLSLLLAQVEKVFPYLATGGGEADRALVDDDPLHRYWIETLKEMALRRAIEEVKSRIESRRALEELSSISPGAADSDVWPLEQQIPLFSLFEGAQNRIGVALTPSCLMVPNKSVSGLFFPSKTSFQSCQLCRRENCPRRRAPYRGSV